MKKIISLALSVMLAFCALPVFSVSADTVEYGDFVFEVYDSDVWLDSYNGTDEVVEIPSEYEGLPVTNIAAYCFRENTSIKKVVIPDSVTVIRNSAFTHCTALEEVEFSENLKEIGAYAFYECRSLKSITLPSGVYEIGEYALGYREDLKSGYQFLIDGFEINGYTNSAADIYADENDVTFYSIGIAPLWIYEPYEDEFARIIKYMGKEEDVIVPTELDGYTIGQIGSSALEDNDYIVTLTIPETVNYVSMWAFAECDNLTSVTFMGEYIDLSNRAFYNCPKLAEFNLNPAYEEHFICSVGEDAFTGTAYYANNFKDNAFYFKNELVEVSEDVKSFEIKSGTTSIADSAFKDCVNLTSIVIPVSVVEIGSNAFDGCTSLSRVTFETYDDGDYWRSTDIRDFAFLNCTSLKSVILPEGTSFTKHSFGYTYALDEEKGYWTYFKDESFVIYGVKGSYAEEDANWFGITFVEYDFSNHSTHIYDDVNTYTCSFCGDTVTSATLRNTDGVWYYYNNGVLDKSNTLVKHTNGKWYHVNGGKVVYDTTLVKYNGTWYYVKDGVKNNSNTLVKYNNKWYHVNGGKWVKDTTLVKYNGTWYYVTGGIKDNSNTLCKYNNKWYHVNGGKWVKDTTLVKYNGTWYYVTGGIKSNSNTLCKYNNKWYHVNGGKWVKDTTLVKYNGTWYYVKKGVKDNSNTLVKYNNKWYHVNKGKWVKDTAIVKYNGKRYYVKGGILQKVTKTVKVNGKYYKLKNGVVV